MNDEEYEGNKTLRMKRTDEPRNYKVIADAEAPASTTPVFTPKKISGGFNWFGLLIPIAILAILVAGGWYGYRKINDQERRTREAAAELSSVEIEGNVLSGKISDLRSQIRDVEEKRKTRLSRAEPEARAKAAADALPEITRLREAARQAASDAEQALRKNEDTAASRVSELKSAIQALRTKVDAAYDKNVEMKAYLNTHTGTLHPSYRIEPRP